MHVELSPAPAADRPALCPPSQPTRLLGRDGEVAAIREHLLQHNAGLLTLLGPAGVGKTRLAAHIYTSLAAAFDTMAWVDLVDIDQASDVLPRLAQAIELAGPGLGDALDRPPHPPRRLLVLDNFEHVLAAARDVSAFLGAHANLHVLVTSRAALRVRWEQIFPVPPLPLPRAGEGMPLAAPAIALFAERARAVRPDFALTADNTPAVAEICARLDGVPLLIEFAAAQSHILTPDELLARLDRPLDLLTSRWTDVADRQQSPRLALDWSYRLLTPPEQALFRRLAVFAGGAPLRSIAAVCGDPAETPGQEAADEVVLATLGGLVDQSLLRRADSGPGETAFRLWQLTRAYALERLVEAGEGDAVRRRHAEHFLALAEQAEAAFHPATADAECSDCWSDQPDQATRAVRAAWLDRIDRALDDLRTAHAYFQADDSAIEERLRLAAALEAYWSHRGELAEGRRWLEAALAARPPSASALAPYRAHALYAAGRLAEHQGDLATARRYLTECITLYRELGDRRRLADALRWRAAVAYDAASAPEAAALLEESLAIYQGFGDRTGVAKTLNFMGELARLRGDYDRAAAFYDQSLALYREAGHTGGLAVVSHNLGYIAQHRHDYQRAVALFSDALALYRDYDDRRLRVICLAALAGVAMVGRPAEAARLFAAAEAHLEAMGARMQPADLAEHERNVAAVRAAMDEQDFAQAWAEGRRMSLEQALDYVQATRPAADPPAPPAPPAPVSEPLTAREREVAELIARGLTNRQIAASLVIAERTVDKHVGNMLGKLGFASRAQIAAWAVERRGVAR